ncbi:MAG: hypothetical protein WD314_02105 [Trueperaceae bacterium]
MRDTIFYGDIHNHNALGYGKGSLERSIDIAKTHLDFFAFTGHARWHDLVGMEGERERHWLEGFERHTANWEHIQNLAATNNRDGEFVQFLGYEWHSSRYGDQCVVFPADHQPLFLPDNVEALRHFCREREALMIPHHIAYPTGNRGVNWDVFEEGLATPVVEIYSEHGNSEYDRGDYDFFRHSFGGRVTANTAQAALARGTKFGFVASSDNHRGFPGAYGEGLMGVLARDLSRKEIMRAVRARRTYALTGDRIELRLEANGKGLGEDLGKADQVELTFDISGREELEMVEVIHNGRTIRRVFPDGRDDGENAFVEPVQVRFEWGWGPWKDLALERITDWRMSVSVEGGELQRFFPCLQSGPFSEEKRHRFHRSGNLLDIRSYTSRREAFQEDPNQSVILEVSGGPATRLRVKMEEPSASENSASLAELIQGSANYHTGPFPKESFMFRRLTTLSASRVGGSLVLNRSELELPGYLYFRVKQKNGQMAWSSPWFLS